MNKIPSLRAEPQRDKYQRYVLPHPDSGNPVSWTRATTLKGALEDKEGLISWKQRIAVQGAGRLPGHVAKVNEIQAEIEACTDWKNKKALKDQLAAVLEEVHQAGGGNDGADRGTQAHTLAEWADAGRLDEVRHLATDSELADLQAYLDTCDSAGIARPSNWLERITVNTQVDTAGTLDRIVRMPDGTLRIGDYKSQKDFTFGYLAVAAQLAQYAHADAMLDPDTDTWMPMPDVDKEVGIVMHVPVGSATCTLIEIDLVAGWRAAQTAYLVRELRSQGRAMGRVYTPPDLAELIANTQTVAELEALWRTNPSGWSEAHINQAKARRRVLATLNDR